MFCSHKAILKCMFFHQIPKSLPYLRRLHVSGWIALHDLIRREVYGRPWPPAPAGGSSPNEEASYKKIDLSAAWHIRLQWKLFEVLQIPLTRTQQSCFKDCWTKCLLQSKSLDCSFFFFYIIGSCPFLLWLCCVAYCMTCVVCARLIMMNKQTGRDSSL